MSEAGWSADMPDPDPVRLEGKVDLQLPDGSHLSIEPGPGGKGVSIVPGPSTTGATSFGGKGRPPRGSTLELRRLLQEDATMGAIRPARQYLDWMTDREPTARTNSLQQIVYRELRALRAQHPGLRLPSDGTGADKAGKRGPGRRAHPVTIMLREKIARDRAAGQLREPTHYIREIVQEANIGIKRARPIVYRELRAARDG
jgi:hypothetical protein